MEKDMTHGTPWKHILWFSLPILGGMILQLLYTTVDAIIVGNFVGEAALGAMNTSISYSNVLLSIATGMSTGAGILLAQYFGAGDRDRLKRGISTMHLLLLGLGLVLTVLGLITAVPVLRYVLGVPENTFVYASRYMRIYFCGLVFQFVYNAFAAELRSVGDSGATMKFLLVSSVSNVGFDLLFVIGLGWGVSGAALGTVLAQLISAAVSFYYVRKHHPQLWIPMKELLFDGSACGTILKLGIPVTIQTIVASAGIVAIQRLVNSFGSSTMAGLAAANKIEGYAAMPNVAFASGMATYAGQNAGAGDLKRVWKGYLSGLVLACGICAGMGAILFLLAHPLIGLFGCSGDALDFGVAYLRFMACVLVLCAAMFVSRGLLQGTGDVLITSVLTIVTLGVRIVFAYSTAGIPAIGRRTIYLCMGVDFSVSLIVYLIRVAQGKWKKNVLVRQEAGRSAS